MCYPPVSVARGFLVCQVKLGVDKGDQRLISDTWLTKCGDLGFPSTRFEFKRCKSGHSATQRVTDKSHLVVWIQSQGLFDVWKNYAAGIAP